MGKMGMMGKMGFKDGKNGYPKVSEGLREGNDGFSETRNIGFSSKKVKD